MNYFENPDILKSIVALLASAFPIMVSIITWMWGKVNKDVNELKRAIDKNNKIINDFHIDFAEYKTKIDEIKKDIEEINKGIENIKNIENIIQLFKQANSLFRNNIDE